MSEGMNEREVKLEAYVDGTLGAEERAAFERQIAADAGLRADVEAHRRIDSSIRRLFAPATALQAAPGEQPAVAEEAVVAGRITPEAVGTKRSAGGSKQLRRGLLAAALLLVAAGVYYFGPMGPGADVLFGGGRGSGAEYYHSVVAAGFRPMTVCENDAQFKAWTNDRLGTPLLMHANPAIALVGWNYGVTPMSDDTSILLAKVNGHEVVVLMDKQASHPHSLRTGAAAASAAGGAGLSVFKRTVGSVVMYEITPEDKAWVTDRFYQDCGTGG